MLQGARARARAWASPVGGPRPACSVWAKAQSVRGGSVPFVQRNVTQTSLRLIHLCPSRQEHWKYGGHKKACPAYVIAAAAQAQQDRLCKRAAEAEQCLVCLEPPREPTTLPCGHAFCTACVVELRAKGVSETCPLCRSPLPPGPEKLFELGYRVWAKIVRAVGSNCEWPPLSASQQGEMDGAIVMLQEAADQVSGVAMFTRLSSVGSLTTFAMALAPHTRATLGQPRSLAASTSGARAWRSTTRDRWRRTRLVPRGVTLTASGRSAPCTTKARARM